MADQKPAYTVLARRYRPQAFADVVGQQHVAQALKNAILADRVAHAYLFTGARGVGKTSMARILAKALNCPHVEDGEPCQKCEMCLAIASGSDVDVLEIDGASNRGIDDIRALRANVGIRSMRTRVKLYIIDEVHMLTKEAFNALLKTLEEPPPNVKFVFCTTEPQKVPDTILSRCQRFDFSSIETQAIAHRLADIAEQEGVEVANDAIDLVARRAGGSMRDSQSLFDQLLAFGGARIEATDVNQLLGTADEDRLIELVAAIRQRQQAQVLQLVNDAIQNGVQLGNLLDQLVNLYRDLMIVKCGADSVELLELGPGQRESLATHAQQFGMQTITAGMQILSETKLRLFRVPHARALLDLALIRLTNLEDLESVATLVQDLKNHQGGTITIGTNTAPQSLTSQAQSQKKNLADDESARIETSQIDPQSGDVDSQIDLPVQSESLQVSFEPGQEEELWQALLSRVESGIGNHLKQACSTRIQPPKNLQVLFRSKFAFSREYFLQKPEHLRIVEQCLQELTGQAVKVQMGMDESEVPAAKNKETKAKVTQPQSRHEFVKQAESIFTATVTRTDRYRKNE